MSTAGQMRGWTRKVAMAGCVAGLAALGIAQPAGSAAHGSGTGQTGTQTGSHQAGGITPASSGASSPLGPASGIDAAPSPFPDVSRQKRNDERQRRLVSDTDRLLALTSQLKAEVATTGAETMSPEMLKQMAEIEKLARSVKDKMRD